ncbi:MAG: sugar-binding transcriptional regulator [Verrucomicrobia bacterium]|nr:sugar-binding transcriptional regulator [Verrucomicrobiota bacterium]
MFGSSKQEEKLDLAARAAWLYYVAGNTQHEIARKLKISRPAAQRLVAMALAKGIVKVRVHHRTAACAGLAEQLRQRFQLSLCEVVPADGDGADNLLRKLAVTGAQVMETFFSAVEPKILALSTGRTLKAVVEELSEMPRSQHRLVSLVGAFAKDGASNRYDVTLRAAEKTGSKYFLLPAPMFADSPEERKQWCHHRLYRVVENLSAQADAAFVGVGEIGPGCPIQRDGFVTKQEVLELQQLGAVGEMLGWAFDIRGQTAKASTHARVTSVPLRSPPTRPVIAFAGGLRKVRAVLGALRGQWVNGLVTDEGCAKRLLEARD